VTFSVLPPIPMDTAKAARAIFGQSNFYLAAGDWANQQFSDLDLNHPYAVQRTASNLIVLYLVTIFQHMETLPDHRASEALRKRVDWKYALHLPLNFPGLGFSSFCEFRQELLREPAHQQNLLILLANLADATRWEAYGYISQDPLQVIAEVCLVSRLEKIWETFSQALEALAACQPEWLLSISLPHWYERYSHPSRSPDLRAEHRELEASAQVIGSDGSYLLEMVSAANDLTLKKLSCVSNLEQVWREQFEIAAGKTGWKKDACAGCGSCRYTNMKGGNNHN
jgi:hypothetical protein